MLDYDMADPAAGGPDELVPYVGLAIIAVAVATIVYAKKRKKNRDYLLNK